MIGMDVNDGNKQVVDTVFRQRTDTTYPLLIQASDVGRSYGFTQHNYAVIDHEGILRYRSAGTVGRRFDEAAIRQHIERALAALGPALLDVEAPLAEDGAEVQGLETTPQGFSLETNYPNPFNGATAINFSIANAGKVRLRIFNALGRQIVDLVATNLPPGRHSAVWDGQDAIGRPVSSGIYFYQLISGKATQSHKMLLVR